MPIRVNTIIREPDGTDTPVYADFESEDDWIRAFKLWMGENGPNPFPTEANPRLFGSDAQIVFLDPDNRENYLSQNKLIYAAKHAGNGLDINGAFEHYAGWEVYRERGEAGHAPFRTRRIHATRGYQQRMSGVRAEMHLRELGFGNNSNTIEKIKDFLRDQDNEQHLTTILLSDIESHIKINKKVRLTTYREVVDYYLSLGCIVFSIVLYFSSCKLILYLNEHFNFKYTAGNAKKLKHPVYSQMNIPLRIRNSMREACPSSLIPDLLASMGTRDPAFRVGVEDLARLGAHFQLNMVMFRLDNAVDSINEFGDKATKMIVRQSRNLDGVYDKYEVHNPVIFYDQRRDVGNARSARRFDVMMFVVSDLWDETMHAEAIFNYYTVHNFMKGTSRRLSPLIKYEGVNLIQEHDISSELFASNQYRSSGIKNFLTGLVIPRAVETVISSSEELSSFIKLLKSEMQLVDESFKNNVGMDKVILNKAAVSRIYNTVPRKVSISIDLFKDKTTTSLTNQEPFNTRGITSLYELFCYLYYLINLSSDAEFSLDGLKFCNATVANSMMDIRKLAIHEYLAENQLSTPRCLNSLGSIEFMHDHEMYKSIGGKQQFFKIHFSFGDTYDRVLVERLLSNESLTLSCLVNKQVEEVCDHYNSLLESETDESLIKHYEDCIAQAPMKSNVIDYYSIKNIIHDMVNQQKTIDFRAIKATTGAKHINSFNEKLTIPIEIFEAFTPSLLDAVQPVGYDSMKYINNGSSNELILIDLKKAYSSILQGAYKKVYCLDVYGQYANVGGLDNPCGYSIDVSEDPLISYFIDYGMVYIDSIDWTSLSKICPEYFNYTSAWWKQYRKTIALVDCYVIINTCATVCQIHKLVERKDMTKMYKKIQSALGIKYGFFDFNKEQRRCFHKCPKHENMYAELYETFGDIITDAFSKRLVIDHKRPFEFVDGKVQLKHHWARYDDVQIDSIKNTNRVFTRYAQAIETMYNTGKDLPDFEKKLKLQVNNYIGSLKYTVHGGVRTTQLADVKAGAIRKDAGERPVKRAKTIDQIHDTQITYAPNSVMWVGDIIGQEDGRDDTLVVSTSVKVQVTRNTLSALRRYVMNTCRFVMDKGNSLTDVYRTATDSLLMESKEGMRVMNELAKLRDANYLSDKDSAVCHSYNGFSVEKIDMNFTKNGRQVLIGEGPEFLVEKIDNKFYDVRFSNSYSGHDDMVGKALDSVQLEQLEATKKQFTVYKDSEILYQVYTEEGRPFDHIPGVSEVKNGIDLHTILFPLIGQDDAVKDLYEVFQEESYNKLYDMKGCLMVGDPGAGKTFRSKLLCKHSYQNDIEPVVTAAMHSIVNLYGGYDLSPTKRLDSSTIHSFCKVGIDPEKHVKDPVKFINSGGVVGKDFKNKKCLARKYGLMVCDEIETFPVVFEEFLKVMKENHDMRFYLVGDPLQSAPMMERGFDMHGSVSKYLTNYNKYEFDLQFRNMDADYSKSLELAGKGKITEFLKPSMSMYKVDDDACKLLYKQIQETAVDIIEGKPTRVFACANYNFQMCIVTSVLQNILIRDEDIMHDNTILYRTGCTYGSKKSYRLLNFKENHYREFGRANEKKPFHNSAYKKDKNGPGGVKSLFGMPLIMKKGIEFRVMNRFKTAIGGEYITKVETLKMVSKCNVRLIAIYEGGSDSDPGTYRGDINYTTEAFVFENSTGEKIKLTSFEVSMYLVYAFAIQREFVLGTTLDRLTIVQPYFHAADLRRKTHTSYRGISQTLHKEQGYYKEDASQTKLARLMRVCVTRVKEQGKTCVLDIDVGSKKYWIKTLWETDYCNLQHRGMNMNEFEQQCVKSIRIISTKEYTWKVIRSIKMSEEIPMATLPDEMKDAPVAEVNGQDVWHPKIQTHMFPLYLVEW